MKKTVLLLCGGKSEEHEISLISAKCVLDALDRKLFDPVVVGISRKGVWHLEEETTFFTGEFRADKIKLNESAPTVAIAPFRGSDNRGRLIANGKEVGFDVVFPLLHGPFGEDGTMQGLFDIAGVPYVGSGCGASSNCMDKVMTKTLCAFNDVPVADFVWLSQLSDLGDKADAIRKLGFPVFVKPSRLGSSVGIEKVTHQDQLASAVQMAFKYDSKVLIEKGVSGREIECAVLGNRGGSRVAVAGEIIPSPKIGWYSYEGKYLLEDGAKVVVPADLDAATMKKAQTFAQRVYDILECDGMARVDLFLENGTGRFLLNEVNTIPGFTPISMYPKMWQASGLTYSGLITELLNLALQRVGR